MSGDRGYRDLDVISYGQAAGQKKPVKRSGSIRTNNARKGNLGDHTDIVRSNERRSSSYLTGNVRTIHTKNRNENRNNQIKNSGRNINHAKNTDVRRKSVRDYDVNIYDSYSIKSSVNDIDVDIVRSNRGKSSNTGYKNSVKMTGSTVESVKRPYDVRESSQAYRKKKRRRRAFWTRFICFFSICIIAGCAGMCAYRLLFPTPKTEERKTEGLAAFAENHFQKEETMSIEDIFTALRLEGIVCTQDFLTVNEYSRPGDKLEKVNNIFVHYTANPGTSAANNKSYFQNLAQTHETSASAHFIIGYEGELIQCIPLDEIAYAVAQRNEDSISIECCYLDKNGEFTEETYNTLVHFAALLLQKYGLEAEDLRRHYDEGGKNCPKYYVENEEEWWKFVQDVKVYKDTL